MTAAQALSNLSREEYYRKMDDSKRRMKAALDIALAELKLKGYRLKGEYQVEEDRTGFYLKVRTS